MPRVLVVDDNKETVRAVRVYLEREGFEVFSAYDGETALHILRHEHPDLVVLDLMLPDRDGLEITRIVRKDATLAPDTDHHVNGAGRGRRSDHRLGDRRGRLHQQAVQSARGGRPRAFGAAPQQRRRLDDESERSLSYEGLQLEPSRRKLTLNGEAVELTRIEFELMHALMSSPEHVFTRTELIESALDFEYEGMERSLDTHVKNLRKKARKRPEKPAVHSNGLQHRLSFGGEMKAINRCGCA